MIEPRRALVRPRVLSPITGEALPLDDFVSDAARQTPGVPIQIVGGLGSGKTTALCHLRAVLAEASADFTFLEEADRPDKIVAHLPKTVVFTSRESLSEYEGWLALRLAPWGEDEALEYLLARHKSRCGAIFADLRQSGGADQLEGIPELWTLVLDALAEQRANLPLQTALRIAFLEKLTGADAVHFAGLYGLACVLRNENSFSPSLLRSLQKAGIPNELVRLLKHAPVQRTLAIAQIASDLAASKSCDYFKSRLPRSVVAAAAEQIRNEPAALAQIRHFLTSNEIARHPMAVSIYHHLDRQWLRTFPASAATPVPSLMGAYLDRADWPAVDLRNAVLSQADLSFAILAGASLQTALCLGTNFHGANLAGANLHFVAARDANFSSADLSGVKAPGAEMSGANFRGATLDEATFYRGDFRKADFTGASLVKAFFLEAVLLGANLTDADLTDADFTDAKLVGIDFRTAQIDGTRWRGAGCQNCNFEEVAGRGVDFAGAKLHHSLWTGSSMEDANFAGADLHDTGLADIDWERANLHDADLRGASFHLGSSRSGLVGSPIAREGSMTGFYTDDFTEQDFKAPEEIRKANLRGADLRGANIEGVDFYLVDLRDALYDATQAAHFLACGAILQHRGL